MVRRLTNIADNLVVVGVSNKLTPAAARKSVYVPLSESVCTAGNICKSPHVSNACLISTCNRTEVYVVAKQRDMARLEAREWMMAMARENARDLDLFDMHGEDAIEHLMSLAAGLESSVVGEDHIANQIKEAWRTSRQGPHMGSILDEVFKRSMSASRAIRSTTRVGQGKMSIPSIAVHAGSSDDLHPREEMSYCVVGTGDMGTSILKYLIDMGAAHVNVVTRDVASARSKAPGAPPNVVQHWESVRLVDAVSVSDVVFLASGSPVPIITESLLGLLPRPPCRKIRKFVDISMPPNADISRSVTEGHVEILTIDDINNLSEKTQHERVDRLDDARKMAKREAQLLGTRLLSSDVRKAIMAEIDASVRSEVSDKATADRIVHRLSTPLLSYLSDRYTGKAEMIAIHDAFTSRGSS